MIPIFSKMDDVGSIASAVDVMMMKEVDEEYVI
jgi:hypothetical protein